MVFMEAMSKNLLIINLSKFPQVTNNFKNNKRIIPLKSPCNSLS